MFLQDFRPGSSSCSLHRPWSWTSGGRPLWSRLSWQSSGLPENKNENVIILNSITEQNTKILYTNFSHFVYNKVAALHFEKLSHCILKNCFSLHIFIFKSTNPDKFITFETDDLQGSALPFRKWHIKWRIFSNNGFFVR